MTFEGYNEVNGSRPRKDGSGGGQKAKRKGNFKEAMAMFGGFSRRPPQSQ